MFSRLSYVDFNADEYEYDPIMPITFMNSLAKPKLDRMVEVFEIKKKHVIMQNEKWDIGFFDDEMDLYHISKGISY